MYFVIVLSYIQHKCKEFNRAVLVPVAQLESFMKLL